MARKGHTDMTEHIHGTRAMNSARSGTLPEWKPFCKKNSAIYVCNISNMVKEL